MIVDNEELKDNGQNIFVTVLKKTGNRMCIKKIMCHQYTHLKISKTEMQLAQTLY